LTASDIFTKLLFKGLLPKGKDKEVVEIVKAGYTTARIVKKTIGAAMPRIRAKIGKIQIDAMLDSRAEVNIITRALADKVGLTIYINLYLAIKIVSREKRKFDRTYKDIEVSIRGISNI
jgi:hypothetical protein